MVTEATIVCPECGHAESETMPTNACRVFYVCLGCGVTLNPLPGDCCVFCSYADHRCPPKQDPTLARNMTERTLARETGL